MPKSKQRSARSMSQVPTNQAKRKLRKNKGNQMIFGRRKKFQTYQFQRTTSVNNRNLKFCTDRELALKMYS